MSARASGRVAPRQQPKRRRFAVRPTVRLAVVLACAAVMLVLAGNMRSIALAAGAGTLLASAACGLASVLLAYRQARRDVTEARGFETWNEHRTRTETGQRAARLMSRFAAAALPVPQTASAIWERLDQRGELVETFSSAEAPSTRGRYRRRQATVELRDCLDLWHARLNQGASRELCVPPQSGPATGTGASQALPAGQPPFLETQLDTAMVRPYERGDSLRAVSWRQTAHHGQLMSFESAPAGTARTILLVNTTVPGHDDALAAEIAACFATLAARGARPFLTDGIVAAQTERDARTFTAGLHSVKPSDSREVGRLTAGARSLATAGGTGLSQVIVVTVAQRGPQAALAQAARAVFRDCPVHVIAVPDDEEANADAAEQAEPPANRPSNQPACPGAHPLPTALATAACCLVSLAATLSVLVTLIAPAGWTTFAAVVLALVTLDATVLGQVPVLRRHRVVRILITVLLLLGILCAGAVLAVETIGLTRGDLLGSVLAIPRDAAAGESIIGPLPALAGILVGGIMQLVIDQWVPVEVIPVSDAALILAVALIAVPLRVLLACRRLRPIIAALPLAVLAVRLVCMGTPDGAPWMPVILACLPALITLIRPQRHWFAQVSPLAAVSVALACVLAPHTLAIAQRIPLDLHISSDAIREREVNSLIDLREDLQRGRSTTALTYSTSAGHTLYLRLSTLDSFDGRTWSAESASDAGLLANLFGGSSGANALADGSPELTPAALVGRMARDNVGALSIVNTHVTIQQLVADNLPVPSGTVALEDGDTALADAGWRWTADGSVSGATRTEEGLQYLATSAYLDPITRPDQLDELSSLPDALERALEGAQADGNTGASLPPRSAWLDGIANLPDRRYRELPANLPATVTAVTERARKQGVGAVSSSDTLTTLNDQLAAMSYLLDYFTDGAFSYTLDTPDGNEPDNLTALGAFLERKSGWCAHYATALAVLGRDMGLSTRVALGYRARETAATSGPYRATNRNLHTWTEVFLTGIGWVPFDVTPSAGTSGTDGAAPGTTENTSEGPENEPDAETPTEAPRDKERPADDPGQDTTGDQAETPASGVAASPLDALLARISSAARTALRWLQTAAPYLVGGAVALAAHLAPRTIRARRTKRRLNAIRTGAPQAAQAAWDEVTDTARDAGASWPASATEEDIVPVLIARINAAPNSRAVRDIERLARAVCHARYAPASAPAPEPVPDLATVQRLLATLDQTATARPVLRRIFPPSVTQFLPGRNWVIRRS